MIRSDQILKTVEMIQKENLDVRTVTMGISLLDCRADTADATAGPTTSPVASLGRLALRFTP